MFVKYLFSVGYLLISKIFFKTERAACRVVYFNRIYVVNMFLTNRKR